jgi:hypothetical protein
MKTRVNLGVQEVLDTHCFTHSYENKGKSRRFPVFRLLTDFVCLLIYEFLSFALEDSSVFGNFVITLILKKCKTLTVLLIVMKTRVNLGVQEV